MNTNKIKKEKEWLLMQMFMNVKQPHKLIDTHKQTLTSHLKDYKLFFVPQPYRNGFLVNWYTLDNNGSFTHFETLYNHKTKILIIRGA